MTTPTTTQADFFNRSTDSGDRLSASAAFKTKGTVVAGVIAEEPSFAQQTEFGTGIPLTFSNGDPRMQMIVVLQTELRNWEGATKPPSGENGLERPPADDIGLRVLFVKYKLQDAIGAAMAKAGVKTLEVGGELKVKFVDEEKNAKGFTSKLYAAQYTPPAPGAKQQNEFFNSAATDDPAPF